MRFLFFRHTAIALIWAMAIFCLYSIPGRDLVYGDPWTLLQADKLGHMIVFAAWVVMLMAGFRKQDSFPFLRLHARKTAFITALIYGGVLEFYQGAAFEGRTSDPVDFAANALGSFIGLIVFRMVYGRDLARA